VNPFDGLTFEGFRSAARDENLSVYAKIGFPDSYREGAESAIFADITSKLTNLRRRAQRVLDIGPGCSPLPTLLLEHAQQQGHRVFLADSPEMLVLLPTLPSATKLPGRFPQEHRDFVAGNLGTFDAIVVYSVIQYVFSESSLYDFLDSATALLSHGGQLLVGDIPNASMRQRHFSSPAGRAQHVEFARRAGGSPVVPSGTTSGKIDDGVMLSILARYRAAGFHAYVLPQAPDLPMANRREDVLIVRP
jgi:2-polyprenyl-3-methyl-5-hydroxy-6-metoxy-1,4-benzoquinol methylase